MKNRDWHPVEHWMPIKDMNGDGYTNIEKYFNGIDPTKKIDWSYWGNNKDTLLELVKSQGGLLQ